MTDDTDDLYIEAIGREAKKTYLGDGAYATMRNGDIELTTEDGVSVLNRVVLGPQEYANLVAWVDSFRSGS